MIVQFFDDPTPKSTINKMRQLLGKQRKQEEISQIMMHKTVIDVLTNIDDESINEEDKLTAIEEIIDAEDLNKVTKKTLQNVLRWVVDRYIF